MYVQASPLLSHQCIHLGVDWAINRRHYSAYALNLKLMRCLCTHKISHFWIDFGHSEKCKKQIFIFISVLQVITIFLNNFHQ